MSKRPGTTLVVTTHYDDTYLMNRALDVCENWGDNPIPQDVLEFMARLLAEEAIEQGRVTLEFRVV